MKGYKLLNLNSKQIFLSGDIVFHEKKFPFHGCDLRDIKIDPFESIPAPIMSTDDIPNWILHSHISSHSEKEYGVDAVRPQTEDIQDQTTHVIPDEQSVDTSIQVLVQQELVVTKSNRQHVPPTYLREYHCNLIKEGESCTFKHTLDTIISYDNFSLPFR